MDGFASCAREKFVCMLKFRPDAPWLENGVRVESLFEPPRQRGKRPGLRLEDRDFCALFVRRADQRGMAAAVLRNGVANERSRASGTWIKSEPHEAPRPIK